MTRDAVIEAAEIIKYGNAAKARIADLRACEIQNTTVDVQTKAKTNHKVSIDCTGDDMCDALCSVIQTRINSGVARLTELGVSDA